MWWINSGATTHTIFRYSIREGEQSYKELLKNKIEGIASHSLELASDFYFQFDDVPYILKLRETLFCFN